MNRLLAAGVASLAALAITSCRPRTDFQTLTIDGSTTAYPIVSAMGEDFGRLHPDLSVVVNRSGTGSGFQKFGRGEVDIAMASRPMKPDEERSIRGQGIDFFQLPIAYDGVSIIVNPENTWARNLTLEQLKRIWSPGSKVRTWHDVDSAFPDERINFYGPTDNHGTFEFFTETVVGRANEIRPDYQSNPEYTAIIQAVAGDRDGIAYVGYSYFDTNRDKVNPVAVDGVAPSDITIRSGRYAPLARPLYLYVSESALREKIDIRLFLGFALSAPGLAAISEARYVPLPDADYVKDRRLLASMRPPPGRSL